MLLAGCTFVAARFRRTTPLVLIFSLAGGLSLFAQHHALTILTPGGVARVKGFAAYRQAREHFIQKDWHEARLSYQSGLARGVVNHEMYERLAESLVNLGLPDNAIPLFNRAIITSRNDPEPYLGLGGIYQARGEFDATILVYERAIDRRVLPDRFHLEKARIYYRIGELDRARSSLRTAAAMGVKRELLYMALADLAFFSRDMGEAYSLYERVLSYRPHHALAYNGMANIRHIQSRFEEALKLYLKALELAPNDPTILNNAGAAYLELGILDKAYQSVSKALAIYPILAEAHYNMGRLFELAGAPEEAMESYRKALSVNPNVTGAKDALESLEGGQP
jgi:tetratricopeptide (TPR) repeat protein